MNPEVPIRPLQPVSPWIHRFILLTALATLALIGVGGLVTSHGVGMSVPDWPNTYGYNLFFFPVSKWVGGIFYEHTHRLLASGVGFLTTVLALWLYGKSARRFMRWAGVALLALSAVSFAAAPQRWADAVVLAAVGFVSLPASFVWPRSQPAPKWLRRLGLVAFFAVVLQGVLGGLRVVFFKDQIGIFHAALAQLFFVLLCVLALFTRKQPVRVTDSASARTNTKSASALSSASWLLSGTTFLIFCQLLLGATMRHQHAGLSIPDFPLAYGKLWPAMDPASIDLYNARRIEAVALNPITAFQVALQMAHRLLAVLILAYTAACAWSLRRRLGPTNFLSRLALAWFGLILAQALLGAATIWSNKAADVATAHVMVGALSLATGTIMSVLCWQARLAIRALTTANSIPAPFPGQAPGHAVAYTPLPEAQR